MVNKFIIAIDSTLAQHFYLLTSIGLLWISAFSFGKIEVVGLLGQFIKTIINISIIGISNIVNSIRLLHIMAHLGWLNAIINITRFI